MAVIHGLGAILSRRRVQRHDALTMAQVETAMVAVLEATVVSLVADQRLFSLPDERQYCYCSPYDCCRSGNTRMMRSGS